MYKVGLTGGIGSGKSLVANIFFRLGIPVYISDIKAKELMNANVDLRNALTNEFSDSIYSDGELNKKKLAEIIFNDKTKLETVNKIVHPFVRIDFEYWCEKNKEAPYVLNESAILFSSGLNRILDKTISVIAPVEMRMNRVISRDKISIQQFKSIADNQIADSKLIEYSDYLLINDETKLLVPQILSIHHSLSSHS